MKPRHPMLKRVIIKQIKINITILLQKINFSLSIAKQKLYYKFSVMLCLMCN